MPERWEPLGWAGGSGACHRLHSVLRSQEEATRTLARRGPGPAGRSRCRSPLRQLGHRGPDPRAPCGSHTHFLCSLQVETHPRAVALGDANLPGRARHGDPSEAPGRFRGGRRAGGRRAAQSAGGAGASPRAAAWAWGPRRTGAFLLGPGPRPATLASRAAELTPAHPCLGPWHVPRHCGQPTGEMDLDQLDLNPRIIAAIKKGTWLDASVQ